MAAADLPQGNLALNTHDHEGRLEVRLDFLNDLVLVHTMALIAIYSFSARDIHKWAAYAVDCAATGHLPPLTTYYKHLRSSNRYQYTHIRLHPHRL